MDLYSYYRSSAAYRVRIALHYKNLPFNYLAVHLLQDGGQQFATSYKAINPQSLVPSLIDNDNILTQSLAILEYLEELHPLPALLPPLLIERAKVRGIAQLIACDIHPLNNLRVLKYLKQELNITEEQKNTWYLHWLHLGLAALEAQLSSEPRKGSCCFGNEPTLADVALIPQIYNALRFDCPLSDYPILTRIYEHCIQLPAFIAASPENQPDCPGTAL